MPRARAKPQILLVDDEPSVLTAMRLLLDCAGYQVTAAASGEEALSLLEKRRFNLLITDNRMPGMSGVDLAMTSRARWPSLPIVMLTAFPPTDGLQCLDLVLIKPHGASRLIESVERILQPQAA